MKISCVHVEKSKRQPKQNIQHEQSLKLMSICGRTREWNQPKVQGCGEKRQGGKRQKIDIKASHVVKVVKILNVLLSVNFIPRK